VSPSLLILSGLVCALWLARYTPEPGQGKRYSRPHPHPEGTPSPGPWLCVARFQRGGFRFLVALPGLALESLEPAPLLAWLRGAVRAGCARCWRNSGAPWERVDEVDGVAVVRWHCAGAIH